MYTKTVAKAAAKLGTSLENGLSEAQAAERLSAEGANELPQKKRTSIFKKFVMQLSDFMVLVLIAAAGISLISALYSHSGEFTEPLMIMAIVIFNAVVGVVQECKAENAIDALKKNDPQTARVVRGGKLREIPARELVRGDIVRVSQGDVVPADCRLFDTQGISVDESRLTGESLPIEKDIAPLAPETPLAERKNMLYAGTHVLTGGGLAMVTETGKNTETGHIARMLEENDTEETPLQKRLAHTGKVLGAGALGISFLIFVMGVFQDRPVLDMLMTAVSLAVAAIPEGLPATVTVMLAIGVAKMAKENAVVRRLSAVETLGSADVICTDKTGTLTQNKMKVNTLYGPDKKRLLEYAALCTDINEIDGELRGDPTETALAEAAGMYESLDMPCVGELSFTSERRLMTKIFLSHGRYIYITKGAPEAVLGRCGTFGGKKLTTADRKEYFDKSLEFEKEGMRVLACAAKISDVYNEKTAEKGLELLGLTALSDKPRPEALAAVKKCKAAGIRPIMITGDSPETAKYIGKAVGIDTKFTLTGSQLDGMSDSALKTALDDGCNIFARATPAHKLKIVRTLKSMGRTAAMTGDACNDAPALKAADIGCAMGLCGTEVAREAADIVLADDNFHTIVKAAECGRGIYANIKKAVRFLLSSNMGEIITVFSSMCFGFAATLAPVHLLWINLVTDSLPAIALGLDPVDENIMHRPPDTSGKLFDKSTWVHIAAEGAMIGMLAILAGGVGSIVYGSKQTAQTMTFAVLSLSQLVHAFNMRSEKSIFKIDILGNKWLIFAFFAGLLLQCAAISVPALNTVFETVPLDMKQWLCVAAFSLVPLLFAELEKSV